MLFKRGSTISAAEGGCQAEVGGMVLLDDNGLHAKSNQIVACSMASAGFAACMGGEHLSLGLQYCRSLKQISSDARDSSTGKEIHSIYYSTWLTSI